MRGHQQPRRRWSTVVSGATTTATLGLVALAATLVTGSFGDRVERRLAEAATPRRPMISSVSGGFPQHGKPLTIAGSGFSHHGDYHRDPDKLARAFEDWNDGELTTNRYLTWRVHYADRKPAVYDTSGPRTPIPGDGHYRRKNNPQGTHEESLGYLWAAGRSEQEYYFEGYIRLNSFDICTTDPLPTEQFKVVRLYSSPPTRGNVNLYPAIGCSDRWHHVAEYVSPTPPRHYSQVEGIPDHPAGWNHLAIYYKKSSAPNANDGKAQIFWNRRMVWDWRSHYADPANDPDDLIRGDFDSDGANLASDWAIGNYFSGASPNTSVDFDDVLLSHTQARVLLCNASSYASATLCETQEPSAWSHTRIGVKANLGALNRSRPLYLYVVDRAGNVSPGFRVNPPRRPPRLAVGDVSVREGNSGVRRATFRISLSAPSRRKVTVAFATANRTAKAPRDYSAKTGTVSFLPGQRGKRVAVRVKGDRRREPNEKFVLNLAKPANATVRDRRATATIRNDD